MLFRNSSIDGVVVEGNNVTARNEQKAALCEKFCLFEKFCPCRVLGGGGFPIGRDYSR